MSYIRKMIEIRKGLKAGLDVILYAKKEFDWKQMREIRTALKSGIASEIVKQEIAKPELSPKEMAEISEELDKEFYELGREGLLKKYGIVPEKENSEVEKNENILDVSEEMSY